MNDEPSNAPEELQSNQSFDFVAAAAALREGDAERAGRKLTFFDQCQAFAALQNNVRHAIIAKAFGISRGAVSMIAGCLTNHRYPRVARHWRELDEYAFNSRYFTQDLHIRLAKIKYDLDTGRSNHRSAPNRLADKKAYRTIGAFPIGDEFWRVDWVTFERIGHPERNGWYYSYCKPDGTLLEGETKLRAYGAEEPEQDRIPYRTSGYAYNAAFAFRHTPVPRD